MKANSAQSSGDKKWQNIDPILQALCQFEQRKSDHKIQARHFAIRRTWLANDSYLWRMFCHLVTFSKPAIPGLFKKHILGLLTARSRKSGTYTKIASQAQAVQLKLNGNRLRAFFLPGNAMPKGLCLKIIPKKDGISNRTRDELEFRQKMAALECITVPRVEKVEEDEHFLYVSEELIRGQRYRNWRHASLFIDQGIPQLCAMYWATGVHEKPLDTFYAPSLLEDLRGILGTTSTNKDYLDTVISAFHINPDIPVGTCHNDLLPSNLCVALGRLYFFDWEMVSEGPLLPDLLKLPFKYKKNANLIVAVANAVRQQFPMAEQAHHLLFSVYIAERIVQNRQKKNQYLDIWNRHHQHFAA